MKKILVSLLACAMVLSFAACGNKNNSQSSSTPNSSSEISSSEGSSSEGSSSETTDTTAEDEKEKAFYEEETKKVETAIKAGLESGKPEASQQGMDDKLLASYEAVKKAMGENYIPSAPIDATQLSEVYGVSEELIENVIAEGPMISVNVDTFIAVKAKEGKGEDVEKALNAYRDVLVADTMQYPMNLAKIQASKVIRDGDYVYFTLVGGIYEAK